MGLTVSIIIPVYNVEKYLADCLDSVLNQTEPFDQIIVINDGATDSSGEICRSYQLKNPGIQLIEQENAGLSAARNAGIKAAYGDYIIFLDADDMVSSRMCGTIKRTVKSYGFLDVIYYASDIIKEVPVAFPEEGYSRNSRVAGQVLKGFESLKELFPEYYQMSACMSAYRNGFLKDNGIWFIRDILYEDRFFSLRTITEAKTVTYITDKLYIRRFRADSIITSPASRKKIEDVAYGHELEWNYIKNSKKWINDKTLTQYYALCSFYMAFQADVSSANEDREQMLYASAFIRAWLPCLDVHCMSVNELTLLLFVLEKMEIGLDRENLRNSFETKEEYCCYKEEVKKLLIKKCREKLSRLPLNSKGRIGIYGIGKHTECMLDLYRTLIGNIESDIYFIVSQDNGKKEYGGREIRQLGNLYQDTAYVVISSKMYQEDMRKRLDTARFDCERVIALYDEKDAVDFVIIFDVLQAA